MKALAIGILRYIIFVLLFPFVIVLEVITLPVSEDMKLLRLLEKETIDKV